MTVLERDERQVHARDLNSKLGEEVTLCRRSTREVRYKVMPVEFGKLTTPPAPWCEVCEVMLERAAK